MVLFFHGLAIKQAYFHHQRQNVLFLQPIPYTEKVSSGSRVCFPSPSGERSVRIREVEGSIPFKSTIMRRYKLFS